VQDAITLGAIGNVDQSTLWQDRVRIDEGFWRSLREHHAPEDC
jgi:hypothetical protein